MTDGRLPRHKQGQYLLMKRAIIIKASVNSKTSLETECQKQEKLYIYGRKHVFLTKNKG